jgi:hypothetical protein
MNILSHTSREGAAIRVDCVTRSDGHFALVLTDASKTGLQRTRIYVDCRPESGRERAEVDPAVVPVLNRIAERSNERAKAATATAGSGKDLPAAQPSAQFGLERRPGNTKEAVAFIQRWGGTAERNPGSPDAVVGLDLHSTRVTDKDLEVLAYFPQLVRLNLYATPITDAGMPNLAGLTALQVLYLNSTAVGDAGLAHLQKLAALKELGLYNTRVTDQGLASVSGLPALERLTLHGSGITDAGLARLKAAKHLTYLLLSNTAVTDAGVAELKRALPKLQIVR